jgi:hypothetical protein
MEVIQDDPSAADRGFSATLSIAKVSFSGLLFDGHIPPVVLPPLRFRATLPARRAGENARRTSGGGEEHRAKM